MVFLPVNDAPISMPDNYSVNEDSSLSNNVLSNDTDIEDQLLTANLISNVSNGILSLGAFGSFTYTPNPNFFGTDKFKYEVCDNATPPLCVIETVLITVNGVNDPPVAIDDSITTFQDTQVAGDVSLNDTDIDNSFLNYLLISNSTNGSTLFNFDGSFYYTPFPGFTGIDSFTYQVCDNGAVNYCDTAVVYVEINLECLITNISIILEGAYNFQTGLMSTQLNTDRKVLPGMSNNPISGQPYSISPWNYTGNEGQGWTDTNYDNTVVDWILVSFRTGISKETQEFQIAGLVQADGSVVFPGECISGSDLTGDYYIVIEHRNHMAVMSPVKVNAQTGLSWDFKAQDSYSAGGVGAKELLLNTWAMYAADCNQKDDLVSSDINGKDKASWLLDNGLFNRYLPTDINMNGDINGADKVIWETNNGFFGSVKK